MAELNLPNVRKGGDITFRVGLTDNGVSVDWSGLEEKRAFLMADQQKLVSGEMSVAVDAEDPTVLVCTYSGDDRMYLGVNSVVIRAKYMGRLKVYDKKAVNIVGRTSAASGVVVLEDPVVAVQLAVEEVDTTILNNAIDAAIAAAERAEDAAEAAEHMVDIHRGPQGYSAYEIAVQEGYEGTVTDWLASLVGPQGKSAYEVAVEEGFVGTEEEWLLSLVGPQGLSAYQVAVAEGFEGTVTEWLDSLVGPTGATPNLTIGTVETGTAGSTAEATITGTAANPVLNLRIPQGAPGVVQAKYVQVQALPTASASTMDALYLVPSALGTPNVYDVYYTTEVGRETYSWIMLCTTEINLSNYATKAEVDQLEHEVHNLSGKYYGIHATADTLPDDADAPGYAFVGSENPYAIWNFDGEDWSDSGSVANGITGEPGVGFSSIFTPQPYDGTVIIVLSNNDTITVDLNHNHNSAATTLPSGGFLPDVVYSLGTLTGAVTFALAAAVTGNINHYFWMFDTSSTAPTITWPAGLTWAAGSAPTVAASKHYEISVLNGIAYYSEV